MTISDLKIEGIKYSAIININIFEKIHSHGVCNLTLIPDEKFSENEILSWKKQKITVKAEKNIIFSGIITQCRLESDDKKRFLYLTALSLSAMMDFEKKIFTMQSPKKKISDVLKKIAKDFSPAEINVEESTQVIALSLPIHSACKRFISA